MISTPPPESSSAKSWKKYCQGKMFLKEPKFGNAYSNTILLTKASTLKKNPSK